MFKSAILLKDRVFVPDYDSHTDMLEELEFPDTDLYPEFVRVELIPENYDPFTPIAKWHLNVDQDVLPEWFVPEIDEKRVRDAVSDWAAEAMMYCVSKNIIAGKPGKILDPKGGATRAETAAMLNNFMRAIEDQSAV